MSLESWAASFAPGAMAATKMKAAPQSLADQYAPFEPYIKATLYGEVSSRNPDKQYLEAQTILNVIKNRQKGMYAGKNMNPHQIVSAPHQFGAYGGKLYNEYLSGAYKNSKMGAQRAAAIDKAYAQLVAGTLPNNIGDWQFYHNNPNGSIYASPSSSQNVQALRKARMVKGPLAAKV